ncbi:helix-turn-helix domain-containing protein [Pseudomonas sp. NA-150]|uniref:helix-turn-helix domain-containing protein n=1 Tax=Pseudomonas sp. NA-150 TaxID=3367525 RepID=UPI0037C69515
MASHLNIRTYEGECAHHQHDFAQLVLPIGGRMEIEVEGRGACLDQAQAALVIPGAMHTQTAVASSRFLVLDCPGSWFAEAGLASLAQRTYLPISASTRRLIEFADLVGNQGLAASAAQLSPLLLSAMARDAGQRASGIDWLLAQLEANPGAAWSNEAMANQAALSVAQLHRRFLRLFDQTPQAWLAELRMRHARKWLVESRLPIADIALRVGFSDQAALTRAMSRLCDTTPAAWRRAAHRCHV